MVTKGYAISRRHTINKRDATNSINSDKGLSATVGTPVTAKVLAKIRKSTTAGTPATARLVFATGTVEKGGMQGTLRTQGT
jgi:hypothetical protein